MRRGAVKTKESELVALWVPREMLAQVDRAVALEDTDRSKFIRGALRVRMKELSSTIAGPKSQP